MITIGIVAGLSAAAVPAVALMDQPRPSVQTANRPSPLATAQAAAALLIQIRPVGEPVVSRGQVAAAAVSRGSFRVGLDPQQFAEGLVSQHGWDQAQWSCLDALWTRESNWDPYAQNASGAYGIPQALPAWRMTAAGADWRSNPLTQVDWGVTYIADTYGSPCEALAHSNYYGFY